MRFAVVCTDLLFRASIREAIRAEGHEPVAIASVDAIPGDFAGAIIDLNDSRIDPFAAITALAPAVPSGRILGFGSHVHGEVLEAGRAAGCGRVVARSKSIRAIGAMVRGEPFPAVDSGNETPD